MSIKTNPDNSNWLKIAQQVQAIAQAGITYAHNEYDLERYERLRDLSVQMISCCSNTPSEKIANLLEQEKGYPTPKTDVRAAVFKDNKILMVQEKIDGNWSLPGGWCEIGFSPKQNAEKEVFEEAGLKVEAKRLVAMLDKNFHDHPSDIFHTYKLFFLCDITGGKLTKGMETFDAAFFNRNNIPPLSEPRITKRQIALMFEFHDNPDKDMVFE